MVNFVNDYVEAVRDGYAPENIEEEEMCGSIKYLFDILKSSDNETYMKCLGCKYMRYMWNQRRLDENDYDNDTKEQRECEESDECVFVFNLLMMQAKAEYDVIVRIADDMEAVYD